MNQDWKVIKDMSRNEMLIGKLSMIDMSRNERLIEKLLMTNEQETTWKATEAKKREPS